MALGRMRQPQPVQTLDITDYQVDALNIQGMRQLGERRELDLRQGEQDLRQIGERHEMDMKREELEIDDQRRAREDQEYFSMLHKKYDGNLEAGWDEMYQRNPSMAFKVREMENQNRMSMGQQLRQGLENDNEQLAQIAQILQTQDFEQDDGSAWEQVRGQMLQVDSDLDVPELYDPEWVDTQMAMWMTEKEKNELDLAAVKEMMGEDLYQGYARILANANSAEEYTAAMETGRVLLPSKFRAGIMEQFPDSYPGEDVMEWIKEAARDPRDVQAQKEMEALAAYREQQLEETERSHRANERTASRRVDTAESAAATRAASRNLFGSGTEKQAIWTIRLEALGRQFPEGMNDPRYVAAHDALFEEILAMKAEDPADIDTTSARNARERMAEFYEVEGPEPEPGTPDHAVWTEEHDRVLQAARTERGDLPLDQRAPAPAWEQGEDPMHPYAGDRHTAYEAIDPLTVDRIKAHLTQEGKPHTDKNIEEYLEEHKNDSSINLPSRDQIDSSRSTIGSMRRAPGGSTK